MIKKLILLTLFTALAQGVQAKNKQQIEGDYSEPTQTFVVGYENQTQCTKDNGDWDSEMEMCFFDTENTAKITIQNNRLSVIVETVGSNAHMCLFESESAESLSNGSILAKAESSIWNGDDWEKETCEVLVSPIDGSTQSISISSNSYCQDFCGARAWLEIEKATRK